VRAIARAAGYAGVVIGRPRGDLPDHVARELDELDFAHDLVLDTTRVREELGWAPRVQLADALATSVAWERGTRVLA
jgi:nucleoside-diphosphate-sugar epimerase